MITRFTHIKGVGKYINCNIGGKQFEKNTIIFGQNTGGKTTLTDILWSYKTGDSSFIESRKSFGFYANQSVEFFNEKNIMSKFPSQEWSKGYDNIEIFDSQFINENIFEGTEIKFGQQQKLHSIIIGNEGKKIASEINKNQTDVTIVTDLKRDRTKEFKRAFENKIEFENFVKLPKFTNPTELINEIKETITVSKNQQKIKGLFDSTVKLLDNIINQQTKIVLSKSIQTNAETVTKHILENWKNPNHSKDFLNTGLLLTKEENKKCVFCGQDLNQNAVNLLSEYSKLFSEGYEKFQTEIVTTVSKFERFNALQVIEEFKEKFDLLNINIELDKINYQEINQIKQTSYKEFLKKKDDLSYIIDFTSYDEMINIYSEILTQINSLTEKYIFKNDANIESLEKKIFEIETSQTRHNSQWSEFIKEGVEIELSQEKSKVKRELLRKKLNEYSDKLYNTHFNTINNILSELGADFKICDPAPLKNLTGQNERVFTLEFFKLHKINIGETTNNKPRFKTTLSESDKRMLAFAFFYSLLLHDPEIENKIVVFDDPFSSFDTNRRIKTVQLLANPYLITSEGERIEKSFEQLIILTHESEFYKWIFKHLDNPKSLKIIPDGEENGVKKSTIENCNVFDEFIEDKNKKDLRLIKKVINENKPLDNYEQLTSKCRKIMESIFTRKYLFELEDEINKRKSIRTFVTKLNELEINSFGSAPKFKDFIMLCDNLNIELHENNLTNDDGNGISILSEFLKLIKQI
jgi:wobble nucleotide-excising tRNase